LFGIIMDNTHNRGEEWESRGRSRRTQEGTRRRHRQKNRYYV
jgi:hypothetical protein